MYQVDPDDDPVWIQFKNNLFTSISKLWIKCNLSCIMFNLKLIFLAWEIEKDEETDPDYCPAVVDSQPGLLNTIIFSKCVEMSIELRFFRSFYLKFSITYGVCEC